MKGFDSQWYLKRTGIQLAAPKRKKRGPSKLGPEMVNCDVCGILFKKRVRKGKIGRFCGFRCFGIGTAKKRSKPTPELISSYPESARFIPLTRGGFAIVDQEDYEILSQYRWQMNDSGYAVRDQCVPVRKKSIRMHRQILNTPDGMETDHINMNRLDNRRGNLRTVSKKQNGYNRVKRKGASNKYKGVYFHKQNGKFTSRIKADGKDHYLGCFETAEDARTAYIEAAKNLHGQFANFGQEPIIQ